MVAHEDKIRVDKRFQPMLILKEAKLLWKPRRQIKRTKTSIMDTVAQGKH